MTTKTQIAKEFAKVKRYRRIVDKYEREGYHKDQIYRMLRNPIQDLDTTNQKSMDKWYMSEQELKELVFGEVEDDKTT